MTGDQTSSDETNSDKTNNGSVPLADRRRERFCQELSAGATLYDAYTEGGFARPRGNAQRMTHEPEIVARLEYLRHQVEKYEPMLLAFRRVLIRRKLDNIVNTDRLGLFEEVEVKGGRQLRLKPIDQLTPEQRAIIDSIEVAKDGVKLTMPGSLAALAQLAKLDGLDVRSKEGEEHGASLEDLIIASMEQKNGAHVKLEVETSAPLSASPTTSRIVGISDENFIKEDR
jgi:hypothetical protein